MTSKWICNKHEMAFSVGVPCIYCIDVDGSQKSENHEKLSLEEIFHIIVNLGKCDNLRKLTAPEAFTQATTENSYIIACFNDCNDCFVPFNVEIQQYSTTENLWFYQSVIENEMNVAVSHPGNPDNYIFFEYPFSNFPPTKEEVSNHGVSINT